MTLDEHIKRAEQDAVQAESDSDWGFGNFFIDRQEAITYAKECRQLAEWLKELKENKDMLDKIRAEIASYKDDKVIHAERNEMIDIVLEIIDTYKAESEE